MIKGWLLLITDDPVESRIITSFLEAADYYVTTSSILSSHESLLWPRRFDAAVWVAENRYSEIAMSIGLIRKSAQDENLPIVAVLTHNPAERIEAVSVLLRPIRLRELVEAVDQALADPPGVEHQGVYDWHISVH